MPRDADGKYMGLFDEKFREGNGWMDTAKIFNILDDGNDDGEGGNGGNGEGDRYPCLLLLDNSFHLIHTCFS